jgi:hypothetical protein
MCVLLLQTPDLQNAIDSGDSIHDDDDDLAVDDLTSTLQRYSIGGGSGRDRDVDADDVEQAQAELEGDGPVQSATVTDTHQSKVGPCDFEILRVVGQGAFGKASAVTPPRHTQAVPCRVLQA